jgi:hypothetical protein
VNAGFETVTYMLEVGSSWPLISYKKLHNKIITDRHKLVLTLP